MFDVILSAAAELPQTDVAAGVTLIAQGDRMHRLLVLESGTVTVTRDDVAVATIDQPGALFGELSTLLRAPATATVRAVGDCTFRVAGDPEAFLRSRPEVALAVATMLARRLDALTRYLVDVREQYADRTDHLGVVDIVLEALSHQQAADAEPGSDREHEAPY